MNSFRNIQVDGLSLSLSYRLFCDRLILVASISTLMRPSIVDQYICLTDIFGPFFFLLPRLPSLFPAFFEMKQKPKLASVGREQSIAVCEFQVGLGVFLEKTPSLSSRSSWDGCKWNAWASQKQSSRMHRSRTAILTSRCIYRSGGARSQPSYRRVQGFRDMVSVVWH